MKKIGSIIIAILTAILVLAGIVYLIDMSRLKHNKTVIFSTWGHEVNEEKEMENTPKEEKIVFNDNIGMLACIEYDCKVKEFNANQEILEKLKIPKEMKMQNILGVYVTDNNDRKYDVLHDISVFYANGNKTIQVTASIGDEPLTNYAKNNDKQNCKKSIINGIETELFQLDSRKTNETIYYNAIFKYKDVNYVVETKNITEDEFITFVKSIFEIDMKSYIEKKANERQFIGTVLEETTKYMIVEPNEDEEERKSADKICIYYGTDHIDYLYGIGRKVLITYNGTIKETYPAQINSDEISTEGYSNFSLSVKKSSKKNLQKVLNNKDLYKYNSDYNLYYYGLENVNIKINDEEFTLEDALRNGKITLDGIISKANKDYLERKSIEGDMYNDGGSAVYKYNEYTIIKMHTLSGDRDVYIGIPEMDISIGKTK